MNLIYHQPILSSEELTDPNTRPDEIAVSLIELCIVFP